MSYEDTIRRVTAPQDLVRQDGVLKRGDDEFAFTKDPPDLQPFEVYRELSALAPDTASVNPSDLEFGPVLDCEGYRTIAVAWLLNATSAITETGILVPQAQLKLQEGSSEAVGFSLGGSWSAQWFPPAVVDSILTDGLSANHYYRDVRANEFRLEFEGPSGEIIGDRGCKVVLQFDVTPYARVRFGVGVETGSTGVKQALLTSLIR